jgi:hypothetical protein
MTRLFHFHKLSTIWGFFGDNSGVAWRILGLEQG